MKIMCNYMRHWYMFRQQNYMQLYTVYILAALCNWNLYMNIHMLKETATTATTCHWSCHWRQSREQSLVSPMIARQPQGPFCHKGGHWMPSRQQPTVTSLMIVQSYHPLHEIISPWTKWPPFRSRYFRCIFVNEKFCILIKISLKFVPKGPTDNNQALV